MDGIAYNLLDNVDRTAREVMVPHVEMVCLYEGQSFREISDIINQSGHTWYPLCGKDKDDIPGIIHIRDVFEKMQQAGDRDLKDLIRLCRKRCDAKRFFAVCKGEGRFGHCDGQVWRDIRSCDVWRSD